MIYESQKALDYEKERLKWDRKETGTFIWRISLDNSRNIIKRYKNLSPLWMWSALEQKTQVWSVIWQRTLTAIKLIS